MDTIKTIPALTRAEQAQAHNDLIGAIRAYRLRTGATLAQSRRQVQAYLAMGVSLPMAVNVTISEG